MINAYKFIIKVLMDSSKKIIQHRIAQCLTTAHHASTGSGRYEPSDKLLYSHTFIK